MYTFYKDLTLAANVAVAHGIAVLSKGPGLSCKTSGKKGIVEVRVHSLENGDADADLEVFIKDGAESLGRYNAAHFYGTSNAAAQAALHFVQLVGPVQASRAIEKAARDFTQGGPNLHTVEADLFSGVDAGYMPTTVGVGPKARRAGITLSKAHFNKKWCYAVRLGIGVPGDGVERANDTCAYGGCCTFASFADALTFFNTRAETPVELR
jgi:hypothetical protein